jgi:hypothetical protein
MTTTRTGSADAGADNPDRERVTMTSSHDLPARPAGTTSRDAGPARSRGRRAATLLAAAAPLAAALATAPATAAFATAAPPAATTTGPRQTLAAELLTTTLPATTAKTAFTDPKIPAGIGD